jgi:hypothetical protein
MSIVHGVTLPSTFYGFGHELNHVIIVFVILIKSRGIDQNSFIPKNIYFEGHPYD